MSKDSMKKFFNRVLPAPLVHVVRRIGLIAVARMILFVAFSYLETFIYLIRKRGVKAAWNFLNVKLFTPVGPGGAGFFWFFFRPLIKKYPLLYRFPRQLELEITTECSKKCIHCEHTWWKGASQTRKHMPTDDVLRILRQFPNLRWVSLVGEGSSFEHPDILKLIKYVKNREIMCYMVDHLSDWNDDIIDTVVKNDMDGILLSIDGASKKTYESLKVGCDFDNVRSNIQKLIAAKKKYKSPLPEILFSYIAMQRNVNEIPDFVDFVASLGSRKDFGAGSRVGIVRLFAFKQIMHLQLDDIPTEIVAETGRRARKHNMFVNFTGTNVRDDLPEPSCCLAWMEPYIFMDGYISQCCAVFISNNRDFIRKYALGNVLEKNFKKCWHSKPYKDLRCLLMKPDAPIPIQCAGCRVFNTLPRERKYGVIDTHTGKVVTLKDFYENFMGENMKWRYYDVIKDL